METLEEILNFEQNMPVYVIMICIVGMCAIFAAFWLYQQYKFSQEETHILWKALTAEKPQLKGINEIRIKHLQDPEIICKKDIHILRTDIIKIPVKTDELATIDLQNSKKTNNPGNPHSNPGSRITLLRQKLTNKFDIILASEIEEPKQDFSLLIPNRDYFETKIETYIHMDREEKRIAGFQIANLFPNQSILSKMSYLRVSSFKTGNSKIMYLIIVILGIWDLLLYASLLSDQPPDFVFEAEMWGWYFSIALLFAFEVYNLIHSHGHWGIFWSPYKNHFEVEFTYKEVSTKKIIPIYFLEPLYHPTIDLCSVFDIEIDQVLETINQSIARQLTKVISENITLQNDNDRKVDLIEELRVDLDEARLNLRNQKTLAYYEYLADSQVSPEYLPQAQRDWIETFKYPVVLCVLAAAGYLAIRAILDFMEGLTFNTWDKIILGFFGGALVLAMLFVIWERVIRKGPFGV